MVYRPHSFMEFAVRYGWVAAIVFFCVLLLLYSGFFGSNDGPQYFNFVFVQDYSFGPSGFVVIMKNVGAYDMRNVNAYVIAANTTFPSASGGTWRQGYSYALANSSYSCSAGERYTAEVIMEYTAASGLRKVERGTIRGECSAESL